eukprot:m.68108 g.68108  ORF g.68108 m.68108 type:complete len:398 (+) comp12187_c0_seq3:138-1331(+)
MDTWAPVELNVVGDMDASVNEAAEVRQFLIKHSMTRSSVTIYMTNGIELWVCVHACSELSRLNEEYNPTIEMDDDRLRTIMSSYILSGTRVGTGSSLSSSSGSASGSGTAGSTTYRTVESFDDDMIVLVEAVTDSRIKLTWRLTLEKATAEELYEQFTMPLLCMAVALQHAVQEGTQRPRRKRGPSGSMSTQALNDDLPVNLDFIEEGWVQSIPFSSVFSSGNQQLFRSIFYRLHPDVVAMPLQKPAEQARKATPESIQLSTPHMGTFNPSGNLLPEPQRARGVDAKGITTSSGPVNADITPPQESPIDASSGDALNATTLPPTLSPSKHTPSQQAQDETEAASTKASTPAPTSALQITTAELAQAQAQAPAKPIAAAGASEPPAKKKKKKKKRDLL